MTNPKHTDTSSSGDLVERLRKARVWPDYSQSRVTIETAHEAADCIEALEAENERLREWSMKAFTVVEWVSGEGKLLSYPYYDADDLLGDGVELLGVYSSDDARAALGETK